MRLGVSAGLRATLPPERLSRICPERRALENTGTLFPKQDNEERDGLQGAHWAGLLSAPL